MKLHHAKSIEEAIDDLQEFLEADMWHCIMDEDEWACEEDMLKYLKIHFNILRREIKRCSIKL